MKQKVATNEYSLPLPQIIWYPYVAAGFPSKDTWIKVIKNGKYIAWPGITVNVITKLFLKSMETQKGCMKTTKQKIVAGETTKYDKLTHATTLTKQEDSWCNPANGTHHSWCIMT